ncbi:MAG: 50S ribosome-binding GTPase [Desulfobacteraceae bacterium]|nr:50S ribosome-binding GTPase [Desulfobacteraceae bacterium]
MSSEKNSTSRAAQKPEGATDKDWLLNNTIQCPGLTPGAKEVYRLAEDLPKRLAVFFYKQQMPSIWVVFLGGTGTGKSTLFNTFCGRPLSETGVERPKTCGPVLYVHEDCRIEDGYPFASSQMTRHSSEDHHSLPVTGTPGEILILEHGREEWSHLLVVDTPDLDSVEAENRQIAEDLYLLSDIVVFITSEEKYADEVPHKFLLKIIQEKRPYFFLLNKAQGRLTGEEVQHTLETQGSAFKKGRMWLIPYASSPTSEFISKQVEFRDFVNTLTRESSTDRIKDLRESELSKRSADLKSRVGRLIALLEEENQEARKWLDKLDHLYQDISQNLIKEQKARFTAENREYLNTQIRKLFTRYDVLARPRRFMKQLLLTPFQVLGFLKKDSEKAHREALVKVKEKMDLTSMQLAIERFNRSVLERLSPSNEESALFTRLRDPVLVLTDMEIKTRIWQQQDLLATWLEETFQRLSQGIPKTKKWGIYSTSLLWGILIVSFETVVGGGFTVLNAVLGSVLAPFVTKGAVELFAYHEIQKIARELGKRYQQGLISVVGYQRDRYEQCLRSLISPPEPLEALHRSLTNEFIVT